MNIKKTLKTEIEVLLITLKEIQSLSQSLSPEDPKQLKTNLRNLESKICALKSFNWIHLIRGIIFEFY
jgi:hypothetical protein